MLSRRMKQNFDKFQESIILIGYPSDSGHKKTPSHEFKNERAMVLTSVAKRELASLRGTVQYDLQHRSDPERSAASLSGSGRDGPS